MELSQANTTEHGLSYHKRTEGQRDRGTEGQEEQLTIITPSLRLSVPPSLCPSVFLPLRDLNLIYVGQILASRLKSDRVPAAGSQIHVHCQHDPGRPRS